MPTDFNKTLCGPPPLYCNKTQSCSAKLDPAKFVPGLKVDSWLWFDKVSWCVDAGALFGGCYQLTQANRTV